MTAAVHLTDTQLAQYTACGLIVVDGEPCRSCYGLGVIQTGSSLSADDPEHRWCRRCGGSGKVAPELWRNLTEPCPTCKGRAVVMRRTSGGDDSPEPCPNPDCDRGRQVVTLTATCPDCRGLTWDEAHRRQTPILECDFIYCPIHGDVGHNRFHGRCETCKNPPYDGTVTLGRFTIRLLPVVGFGVEIAVAWMPHVSPDQHGQWFIWHGPNVAAGENPTTRRYDWKRTPIAALDPLPQSGQWVVQLEPVAAPTDSGTPARPVNPGAKLL